ncbi:coth-domain-containing protein [Backusella circina FSU 941]|nr:coth-domain-containing protein [Backusella circina FSU 941]
MNKLLLLVLALFAAAVSAANIVYSVISLTSGTRTMGVIVDNRIYPLSPSDKASILHTGEAPVAKKGYSYTVLEGDNVINKEDFSRLPSSVDTQNEFFNRSWNRWDLKKLPIILPKLPIVNRMESDLHIDGEIPTIHFVGDQEALDSMHRNPINNVLSVSVKMSYISPNRVETLENVKIALSGHSTRNNDKLSYKIKISKKDNLFGYRKLKLRAMLAVDTSYMKEFLGYGMYNSIGLPTTKFSYVRVFMNNEPIGLFGLAETFKNPWLRNQFANGDKDYKQGTLFVADIDAGKKAGSHLTNPNVVVDSTGFFVIKGSADLSYLGNNISLYEQGNYQVKEKPSSKKADYSPIVDLTKFIADASNTTTDDSVVALWEEKINVDSFLRGLALEMLISNGDGYYGLANNYLLYDDPETKQIYFFAQDLDISMGFFAIPELLTGNYREYVNFNTRPLSKIFNVPKFRKTFETLLLHITTSLMSEDVLISRIDQVYNMLRDDVEWDKSLPKKSQAMFSDLLEKGNSDNYTTVEPAAKEAVKQMLKYVSEAPTFDQAVNGPMPGNITVVLPLKVWARTKRDNILKFFNQTAKQPKV